jgi:hypothetical protein
MTILQPFFHGLFGIGIVRICEMFFILVLDLFFSYYNPLFLFKFMRSNCKIES